MLLKYSVEMMSFHMSSRRCSSFHMSFFGQLRLPPTLTRPICPVARWDAVWGILYTVYGKLCMHGCLLYTTYIVSLTEKNIHTQVLWTSHSWNIHRLVRCLPWLRMTLNKCRSIFGVNPTKGLLESEAMRWPLRNQSGMVFWCFLGG